MVAARGKDFKGLGELQLESMTLAQRRQAAKTAPGPDLSGQACACGEFGPWGDGTAFYCPKHVPPECRYAGQFFAEMME
jgi:hypothetical protein